MKLIILDRDGVINYESNAYIKSPEEWIPIPGSLEAISLLNRAGFTIAIATNQSGIARGFFDEAMLLQIHEKMIHELAKHRGQIDAIFYCPHHPEDNCDCRKPEIGLLQKIAKHFRCSLEGVPFVGDSYRDIQAALTAKCEPILVKTGNGAHTLQQYPNLCSLLTIYDNLACATQALIKRNYYTTII